LVKLEDCRLGFIYWIASYPKSGNNWTRAFLTALVTEGARSATGSPPEIVFDENLGRFYKPFLKKPLDTATETELAAIRPHAHRLIARKTQNFALVKTHSLLGVHHGTHTVTFDVTAGAIYLMRNPLDVAVTYSRHRKKDLDDTVAAMNHSERIPDRTANRSYEIIGSWSENVASWTKPHDQVLVLRQEDMLADPEAAFRGMVQFLKMDVSAEQLGRAMDSSRSQSDPTGLWRKELTEEQVALLVRRHEVTMKRFGYWLDEFDELLERPSTAAVSYP
jgi:hypothetical protein